MMVDQRPVGFIQTYLLEEWPDYAGQVGAEAGTAGIDLFIGDQVMNQDESRRTQVRVRLRPVGGGAAPCCQ